MTDNSTQNLSAVIREKGGAFEIVSVAFNMLQADEVKVRIVATGMCHTDLVVRDGIIPLPLPIALGHEGAGVVTEIGDRVSTVEVGDHVVLSYMSCGHCSPCRAGHVASCENFGLHNFFGSRPDGSHALCGADATLVHDRFFSQSSFGTIAVANERNVVKVRKDAPLELLGPLGCGIQTSAGAVLNAFALPAGATIAIFGSGAVGLSALMAAVVAGATTIIAVDLVQSRLELATDLGATHVVNPKDGDVVEAISTIVPGGVEYALDTTAVPAVIENAVAVLRQRGTCGLVGAAGQDAMVTFGASDLMVNTKRIIGIIEGDAVPQLFIPRLVDLFMQGKFPIDKLVEFYPLDRINDAAHASESGKVVKPIVRMPE